MKVYKILFDDWNGLWLIYDEEWNFLISVGTRKEADDLAKANGGEIEDDV
jgi:hypothetical protein